MDPFEVLRVEPEADDEAIERAYRERVKESHPDHGGTLREFLRVRTAYDALTSGEAGRADGHDLDARDGATAGGSPDAGGDATTVEYLNYEVLADHGWTLGDEDLFEKAAGAGLDPADRGQFRAEPHETLLQAAERSGHAWPYACRGGACANCAVAMVDGDLSMPANHVLGDEMMDQGIRLSCNGLPTQGEVRVVYNVKHRPDLDDLRLPPNRFDLARAGD